MKLSKMIEKAQELLKEHGDVDVNILDSGNDDSAEVEAAGFSVLIDDDGKALSVLLCDADTLDAFVELGEDEPINSQPH